MPVIVLVPLAFVALAVLTAIGYFAVTFVATLPTLGLIVLGLMVVLVICFSFLQRANDRDPSTGQAMLAVVYAALAYAFTFYVDESSLLLCWQRLWETLVSGMAIGIVPLALSGILKDVIYEGRRS